MSAVGQREIQTQRRVVAFFQNALGYKYLDHWQDRPDNRNVEREHIADWLKSQGHSDKIIDKALFELNKAAGLGGSKTLYDANREVYGLLRYGVKVRPDVGEQNVTVWLIDWKNPSNNDFAIAEEVTVSGENKKRPDLVLYVNGIALGVLELKRSTVSVTEGIRQNLDSQKKEFIQPFFSTVQLVLAGNDTEGLRYGVIETAEKYWLHWKEAEALPDAGDNPLLRELGQLCGKERLLEIIHDFIVFDAGVKKICRHNQYFGVKAAQARVKRREGGIIWHTQGSGKSLTMVWLAKWIREHITDARVLLITDRTELDEQIEKVFKGVSEDIHRTRSGADLVRVLNTSDEWLIASLIHKFGAAEEGDVEQFVEEIRSHLPRNFHAKGEIFVFVDECHRTQSGKLHEAMKFDDMTLVELIVERGEKAVEELPEGIRKSREAVAETIENNVRRLIIDETGINPRYYENMSELLEALIRQRKQEAIDYKEYLTQIVDLTRKTSRPESQASHPASINRPALRLDRAPSQRAFSQADGQVHAAMARSSGRVESAATRTRGLGVLTVCVQGWSIGGPTLREESGTSTPLPHALSARWTSVQARPPSTVPARRSQPP